MKKRNATLIFLTLLAVASARAQVTAGGSVQASQQAQMAAQVQEVSPAQSNSPQVVNKVMNYNDQPLNISGEVEEEVVRDGELDFIEGELEKQKRSHKLNKEKVKGYKKLKRTTEKLVDSTEDYVEERKSSEAMIKDYNKKIKCLLGENFNSEECDEDKKEDKVEVQQAAPVQEPAPIVQQVVVTEEPKEEEEPSFVDTIKVLPYLGISNYNGSNISNITSNIAVGINIESELWKRFAIGLGLNYQTVDFTDYSANQQSLSPYFGGNFGYYNNYYNYYGGWGRDIQMSSIGVDLYGKFYVFTESRLRPYIGAGLGYNRVNFEYQNANNPYSIGSYYFGSETFSANILTGKVMLGAEFAASEKVSLYTEFSYATGLTSFGESNPHYVLPDEIRLRQLNDDFAEAGAINISGGVGISF